MWLLLVSLMHNSKSRLRGLPCFLHAHVVGWWWVVCISRARTSSYHRAVSGVHGAYKYPVNAPMLASRVRVCSGGKPDADACNGHVAQMGTAPTGPMQAGHGNNATYARRGLSGMPYTPEHAWWDMRGYMHEGMLAARVQFFARAGKFAPVEDHCYHPGPKLHCVLLKPHIAASATLHDHAVCGCMALGLPCLGVDFLVPPKQAIACTVGAVHDLIISTSRPVLHACVWSPLPAYIVDALQIACASVHGRSQMLLLIGAAACRPPSSAHQQHPLRELEPWAKRCPR